MREEKEGRKKQARSNKQTTRQSNTAHPRQSLHTHYLALNLSWQQEPSHLFLHTQGDRLDLRDEGGRVEAAVGGHGGAGLVHLCPLRASLLDMVVY